MSNEIRASKVYTRTGDKGKTSLIGGNRVSKADLRLEAYGTVDELNSVIGLLIHDLVRDFDRASEIDATYDVGQVQSPPRAKVEARQDLLQVQCDLFNVGSQLACEDDKLRAQMPNVTDNSIAQLEERMDEFSKRLSPLKNFILPGGTRSAAVAHLARTVCRRAERICVRLNEENATESSAVEVDPMVVRYLNRLSDYFFVLARLINASLKVDEAIWQAPPPAGANSAARSDRQSPEKKS